MEISEAIDKQSNARRIINKAHWLMDNEPPGYSEIFESTLRTVEITVTETGCDIKTIA